MYSIRSCRAIQLLNCCVVSIFCHVCHFRLDDNCFPASYNKSSGAVTKTLPIIFYWFIIWVITLFLRFFPWWLGSIVSLVRKYWIEQLILPASIKVKARLLQPVARVSFALSSSQQVSLRLKISTVNLQWI